MKNRTDNKRYFDAAYKIRALGLDDERALEALISELVALGLKVSRYTLPLRLLLAANIEPSLAIRYEPPTVGGDDAAPFTDIKSALKPISGGNNGVIDYSLYDSGKAAKVDYDALLTTFKKEYKRAPNRQERRLMLKLSNNTGNFKAAWQREQLKAMGSHKAKRSESLSGGIAADSDRSTYNGTLKKAAVYRDTRWTKHK